ncbi:hypothetical protein CVT25_000419 [Psilocybe cyanescens]|uniref:Uncharacterized protein n=1 Tax=Psilocybe cyanescens TaxID=93625 RepID=A0A409XLX5_PSICY|nr:hypothetical protein CVT25_000419 [Psilocybe cyanescens]
MTNPGVDCDRAGTSLHMEEVRLTAALQSVNNKPNNTLLPIAKLPAEILEEIFKICVSWLYGPKKTRHHLAWTQVCCSWRFISLNSSRLWQRIDLCDSRLTEAFLARSKQAPLFVVAASPVKLTADSLAPHAHRLHSINICLFPDDITRLFSIIGAHLSTLTDLSLKVPLMSSTVHLDVSFPLVRRLSLDRVAVKWEECGNLVELNIRNLAPAFCPSISQVHGMFRRSPNLEHVRLEGLVTPCLEITSKMPILLFDIEEMVISGPQASISALLSAVKLAPHSRLRLHTPCSNDIFPRGLPHVAKVDDVIHIPTVRLSTNGIRLLQNGTKAWSDEPRRTLFSISSAQKFNIYNSLRSLIDISFVTKLELTAGVLYAIPVEDLNNLFADLYNLETLCTAFNDLEDLCTVLQLSLPTSSCSSVSTPHLYAPRLRNLSFSKSADLWWHFKDRWLSAITACAKYRHLHSHPIQTIEFLRCQGISNVSTQELCGIVPQVIIAEHIGTSTRF